MPEILPLVINIFTALAGLGITVAGFGFAYTQFISGGGKAKDDLIQTLKETAEAEKEKADRLAAEKTTIVTSHQDQLNILNEKVGKLQGLYEAAEAQKKEYLTILQGMSPDEIQYRKDMREFTRGVAQYMENSAKILTALNEKMQNQHIESQKVDNQVVSTQSVAATV